MSSKSVREALESFVAQPTAGVMVLTGRWGRGKTYLWQMLLTSREGATALRGRAYAYVSLFGVETLAELRNAILVNAEPVISEGESAEGNGTEAERGVAVAYAGRARVLEWFRDHFKWKQDVPELLDKVDLGEVVRAVMLRRVREYVVCIDDIERRGAGLRLLDVLGYIANLRDERRCTVLLILNDDALSAEDREQFALLREKVFDHEVRFEPSCEECVEAVFPSSADDWKDVRESCVRLGIENIRVLQRVRRACERFHVAFGTDASEFREWLARSLPLLVLAHYSKEERHPTLEYVLASGLGRLMRLAEGKPLPEDREDWQKFLSEYGFDEVSVFDRIAAEYLRTGLIRSAELETAIAELRASEERHAADLEFGAAWELYHDSFADNADEVLAALAKGLRRNLRWTSPGNVSSTTTLFRELGRDAEADALVREYVAAVRSEAPANLDIRAYPFAGRIGDATLKDEMQAAFRDTVKPVPFRVAVLRLVGGERWTDADGEAIESASEDEIVGLLHELRGSELHGAVRWLLQYAASKPDHNIVRRRALKALRRIEAENELNRQRMRRYYPLPAFPPEEGAAER